MTQNRAFSVGDLTVEPGKKGFGRLSVAHLLSDQVLSLPVHVVNGVKPGPTLGLVGAIHGPEYPGILAIREVVLGVDPEDLSGTLVAVPVANPVSFAARRRKNTPEWDVDASNADQVFPGVRAKAAFGGGPSHPSDRSLTELMVSVLAEEVYPLFSALIDFHCTGMLGRCCFKIIQCKNVEGELKELCHGMARAFGLGLIHEHDLPPTSSSGYAVKIGIPCCVPEIGGADQSRVVTDWSTDLGVKGTYNVMRFLGMLPGEVEVPEKQFVFFRAPHVRPTMGGYLLSEYEGEDIMKAGASGLEVREGDLLGTIVNPFTFEKLEELRAPVDGFLYLTMRTGLVEVGDPGYAVADFEQSRWIS
jgi:predicted deacylase